MILRNFSSILFGLSTIGLLGCASIPTSGPNTSQVVDQASQQKQNFDFVEVDGHVITALGQEPTESLRTQFDQPESAAGGTRIGIGDAVTVSIWEAAPGGVFGTTPGTSTSQQTGESSRNITLPEQIVGPDGGISVPYAGRIHAAGRTPFQVQQAIEQALADRAIEPQAIVTISKNVSDTVTVSGDVVTGARVPLTGRGDRLLDVIAAAGGAKTPLYETFVRLTRHGTTVTIPMDRLVSDPAENIFAERGDIITLVRNPQTFSVFGATLNNTQIPFGAERINLAQAIAKAGGLADARADPAGVFLFRFEAPPVVDALGAPALAPAPGGKTPVVYHLDLRQVGSYFLASRFPVQDDDIVYVANAPLTDVQKFLTVVGLISGPVVSGVVISKH